MIERDQHIMGYAILAHDLFGFDFIEMVMSGHPGGGQGIGRLLIEFLGRQCATAKLFTPTNASNVPMRTLLAKLDDLPSGEIHNLDVDDPEMVFLQKLSKQNLAASLLGKTKTWIRR